MSMSKGYPKHQGLYDPQFEKDNCGIGVVANIKGEKSHDIVKKGIEILINLTHRGGVGSDTKTGDGAGLMLQIPHEFFSITCDNLGMDLPDSGKYGVGMIFLPRETTITSQCEGIVERVVNEENQKLLGWRDVPRDSRLIGETAKGTEPVIKQIFIGSNCSTQEEFEKRLYIIRKRIESEVKRLLDKDAESFYICSLSSKKIIYKGLLLPDQIKTYYMDLNDINFKSAIAIVHQRYSTNTFPTWDLAQPFRYLAHNGEINTIRGNRNWMNAREGSLESKVFGDEIDKLFPIVNLGGSDSASLDNMFELLVMDGRSPAHAMMMLIPEAWEANAEMTEDKRAFYEYHGSLIEPWDGPAAVTFTDGTQVGAVLDRNGLRPARYVITKKGMVVLSSEAGVLDFAPEEIEEKGRLEPGKIFLIDTEIGKIISDDEVKKEICNSYDYKSALNNSKFVLSDFEGTEEDTTIIPEILKERQQAFGYTLEDLKIILKPMASTGKEPLGSMGNDAPLAVLSNRPQNLFAYFKQLFAQVTNPPIDPIREELVTSLINYIGAQGNILNREGSENPFIEVYSPILTDLDMAKIKRLSNKDFKTTTIPITFKYDTGVEGFEEALEKICERASKRVSEGYNIIVLSDRFGDSYEAAIPSLLAVAAVHHHLIREKTRTKVSLIIETGEARETMHMALLLGYGATAVNPYIAYKSIKQLINEGEIKNLSYEVAIDNYIDAINHGLLKILSKMGISTLRSYHGAQIFEAVGLKTKFVNKHFTGTPSRIEGIGIEKIAEEVLIRHKNAFNKIRKPVSELDVGGNYAWRRDGEFHLFNPDTIYRLQVSARMNNYEMFKEYSTLINNQDKHLCTIRGMFELKTENEIPISEVEPVSEILKRFCAGAMSFGSISEEAHETIAIAMNRIGGKSNSGEGGENPKRYKKSANGDWRRSAIKQVASGRFGVNAEYLINADEIQIKMAQGAKPGEGGQLPGKKVDPAIAKVRHSTPGIDLISPPPHHDIYSIEDLAQLIYDLKCTNPDARINVKLVSEVGVGTVAAGVSKAHADAILISGHDGGTGASPVSSIKHAGLPWELGLSEAQQVLLLNDLRSRVVLQTDGQLKTGRDIVIAALLGAEEYVFATTLLVVLGCTMLRNCHSNTCEMGIATQDPELRKNFKGKPDHIVNFLTFLAMEVREYMAKLGFRTINEMIGRVDKIKVKDENNHWKAKGIDLSRILYKPDMPSRIKAYCTKKQEHGIKTSMDYKLIKIAQNALYDGKKVQADYEIKNVDRAVGAMLSGKIAKIYGNAGLKEDTICFNFKGSAGQSFGAFGAHGLTLSLEGEANDYVGKGLSGAKIIIKTPKEATFKQDENVIAGNTILYGATEGNLYINGKVGERFAVRNSGASAVVEGVGDHCCEYMTGGTVVVIGKYGRNFAAGMSGGIAYVIDEEDNIENAINNSDLYISKLSEEDSKTVFNMITNHYNYTGSKKAEKLLKNWDSSLKLFKKIIPTAYKLILEENKNVASELRA